MRRTLARIILAPARQGRVRSAERVLDPPTIRDDPSTPSFSPTADTGPFERRFAVTLSLPPRPDLDMLRRHARTLQRGCRAGDARALSRLAAVFSSEEGPGLPLSSAQTVIAREYGLRSWSALKREVEARRVAAPLVSAKAVDLAADAERLARTWFALAAAGDLKALGKALAVGKRRIVAAREVMRGDPVAYEAFLTAVTEGLSSRRDRIRRECAHHLDVFGDDRSRPPLVALMEDPVPRVRATAMHALTCHACGEKPSALEPSVIERIVQAVLTDESIVVRRHAAITLGLSGYSGAGQVLRRLMAQESDEKLLRGVAWALAQVEKFARPPVPVP